MALRVLLADESSTIKKVIQLALQDYGVEVKSVPVGLDVLTVAKTFKPDIIFADVLLAKKSGYEVSQELKSDAEMKNTPVILMWSGFMELDEDRAKRSLANDRLEKPFDAELLRSLVRKYVPRTQSNTVSTYLTFPPMPEFEENKNAGEAIVDIDDSEEFQQVPLHKTEDMEADEEGWSQQNIGQIQSPQFQNPNFQTPPALPLVGEEASDFDKFIIPESDLGEPHVEASGEFEEVSFDSPFNEPITQSPPALTPTTNPRISNSPIADKVMSATETVLLERVASQEARAVIQDICWKILPEIAERVVREEINKLLKQAEKDL
jgi:CheY-like chemotaxis protein